MKRDWTKACKMLAKAADGLYSVLKAEQWASGMSEDSEYSQIRYTAYIENIGSSEPKLTAVEAVIDIMQKRKNKC